MPLIVQPFVLLQYHTGRDIQHSQAVVSRMHEESGLEGMQDDRVDNDTLDLANFYLPRDASCPLRRYPTVSADRPKEYQSHAVGGNQVTIFLKDHRIDETLVAF